MSTTGTLSFEMILYRHLTYTDWYAIHAKGRKTGGGDRHIALDKITPDSCTSRFLGGTAQPRKLRVTALGSEQKTAFVNFKDWGGGRNQWTVADQYTNRHPAISKDNGFPEFDDPILWAGSVNDKNNWQENITVYWVRCPGSVFYMGYVIGKVPPEGWSFPQVQVMFKSRPRIGLIRG